jgi:phosphorylase kinase alpha/beta subunit
MTYFRKQQKRFIDIIEQKVDPQDPMNRPHIRFNGNSLEEIDQIWGHAQNDALGYFLWLYCKLATQEVLIPKPEDMDILALFPLYFKAIRYWEDEDSGHWEEVRKINASSIGVVVAGLKELAELLRSLPWSLECRYKDRPVAAEFVDELIQRGTAAMYGILPAECVQADPLKSRRYDAALLFLIYPVQVIEKEAMADQILRDVTDNLQGDYGIRRYLGDSYWAPDYKKKLPPEGRTIDFSEDIGARDALLPKKGEEAQWCIFDPIISVIFGIKFQKTRKEEYLDKQTLYLNRSLGQITSKDSGVPEFKCPELYYLENGRYVPNDHVPLLWTQANLMLSLRIVEQSLRLLS